MGRYVHGRAAYQLIATDRTARFADGLAAEFQPLDGHWAHMEIDYHSTENRMVVRYHGEHVCSEKDHALTFELHDLLIGAFDSGRTQILLDARSLAIRYASGRSEIIPLWATLLDKASEGAGTRVAVLITAGSRLESSLKSSGFSRFHPYFTSEEDADAYLERGSSPE